MIKITGLLSIFSEAHKTEKGNFNSFQTSVDSSDPQNPDIKIREYLDVVFSKDSFPKERLDAMTPDYYYILDVQDAWLQVRQFTDKDGKTRKKLQIFIKVADPKEKKPLKKKEKADSGLPF